MRKGTRRIPLTQGKFAVVDAIDYEHLMQWKWYAQNNWRSWNRFYYYAKRRLRMLEAPAPGQNVIAMHTVIAKRAGLRGREIDHHNRNGLDNRRNNLRPCTHKQNCANRTKQLGTTSVFKGVIWHKWKRQWQARITVNKTRLHLGYFRNEAAAGHAYAEAAEAHFGEFACTKRSI